MKNSVKKEIEKLIKITKGHGFKCSVEGFADQINWNYISSKQSLSENFIREFQDKVDWEYIRKFQIIIKKEELEELEKTRVKNKFQLIRF